LFLVYSWFLRMKKPLNQTESLVIDHVYGGSRDVRYLQSYGPSPPLNKTIDVLIGYFYGTQN